MGRGAITRVFFRKIFAALLSGKDFQKNNLEFLNTLYQSAKRGGSVLKAATEAARATLKVPK